MFITSGAYPRAVRVAVALALLLAAGHAQAQCRGGGQQGRPQVTSPGFQLSTGLLRSLSQSPGLSQQQFPLLVALQQQQQQQLQQIALIVALQQQQELVGTVALQQQVLAGRIAALEKKFQQQEDTNALRLSAQKQKQVTDWLDRQQKQAGQPQASTRPAASTTATGK